MTEELEPCPECPDVPTCTHVSRRCLLRRPASPEPHEAVKEWHTAWGEFTERRYRVFRAGDALARTVQEMQAEIEAVKAARDTMGNMWAREKEARARAEADLARANKVRAEVAKKDAALRGLLDAFKAAWGGWLPEEPHVYAPAIKAAKAALTGMDRQLAAAGDDRERARRLAEDLPTFALYKMQIGECIDEATKIFAREFAAVRTDQREKDARIADNYARDGRLSKEYACEVADEIAARIRRQDQ
jgi:hypothetical protein